MFTNLKLRNRMLLGYGVPIILFIGLTKLIYLSRNKLVKLVKQELASNS